MKTLITIWALVVIAGLGVIIYGNSVINDSVKAEPAATPTIPGVPLKVSDHPSGVNYNPQQTISGVQLQGGQ